jgi:hypothetical protein
MENRPGKDKKARTNEDERKRIWDAHIAANPDLLSPDENEPTNNLRCLVCEQLLKGSGAKYSVANAVSHMHSKSHRDQLDGVNAARLLNGQAAFPHFVERTQEQLTGQVISALYSFQLLFTVWCSD